MLLFFLYILKYSDQCGGSGYPGGGGADTAHLQPDHGGPQPPDLARHAGTRTQSNLNFISTENYIICRALSPVHKGIRPRFFGCKLAVNNEREGYYLYRGYTTEGSYYTLIIM